MKRIVSFKRHAGKIPYFIEEVIPPETSLGVLLGITFDDADCYIPDTVTNATEEEINLHKEHINGNINGCIGRDN